VIYRALPIRQALTNKYIALKQMPVATGLSSKPALRAFPVATRYSKDPNELCYDDCYLVGHSFNTAVQFKLPRSWAAACVPGAVDEALGGALGRVRGCNLPHTGGDPRLRLVGDVAEEFDLDLIG
jgi:hypothetical protein